jgi:hypothetical protein
MSNRSNLAACLALLGTSMIYGAMAARAAEYSSPTYRIITLTGVMCLRIDVANPQQTLFVG